MPLRYASFFPLPVHDLMHIHINEYIFFLPPSLSQTVEPKPSLSTMKHIYGQKKTRKKRTTLKKRRKKAMILSLIVVLQVIDIDHVLSQDLLTVYDHSWYRLIHRKLENLVYEML